MTDWASDWQLWGLAAGSQGYESNAKDHTIFYGTGTTWAARATDLSQVGTSLSAGASWAFENSPASRFDVQHPFSIEAEVTMNNATTGYIFAYGPSQRFSMRVGESAGLVRVRYSVGGVNTTIASLTLPGVGAGDERFTIGWIAEPNPLTTGASDAVRHTLYAFNETDGSYSQTVVTSTARDAGTGTMAVGAQTTAGGSAFGGTLHAFRFGAQRVHTVTETHEDFVAATSEPTTELSLVREFPIVDPACALEDAGELAGPVPFMYGQAVRQDALRLWGPIVNESYLNRLEVTASTYAEVPTRYRRVAPDANYTLFEPWMFYRPVPPACTHLRVRVFVKQWNLGGRMRLRMYAMNRPPVSQAVVDQMQSFHAPYCGADATTTDHGSGGTDGEWVDLGLVAPAVNSDGCTWLVLALDTVGNPGTTVFEIGAIVVEPGIVE